MSKQEGSEGRCLTSCFKLVLAIRAFGELLQNLETHHCLPRIRLAPCHAPVAQNSEAREITIRGWGRLCDLEVERMIRRGAAIDGIVQ
jgi:hypothetical protein